MSGTELIKEEAMRAIKDAELGNVVFDINTSPLTSIKTGGKALGYFRADGVGSLKKIIGTCISNKIKFMIIGDGTNILFNDGYMDMILIRLGRDFNYLKFEGGSKIIAGAAYNLSKFIVKAAAQGYDFSEFSGIPGTLGGSVIGNSGSRDTGICNFIEEIGYIKNEKGNIVEKITSLSGSDFGYRYLNVPDLLVLTKIILKIRKSNKKDILKKIAGRIKRKKLIQPVNARSSGCFFKNIKNYPKSAGELIEQCGLKGFIYGGARISNKHANFIENFKNASSEDIYILSKIAKDMVMERFNQKLEYEVKLAGF